jgi:uncharacterized membrane protein YeiH
MDFIFILEIAGTFAFAVSGALAAMDKKLDPFGVIIIAFVTAIGGGTIRDVLIGDLPVSWLLNQTGIIVIIVAVIIALLFSAPLRKLSHLLFIFDAAGLGLFTLIGIEKGIAHGFSPGICIALGTITGSFGGVLRDVLLNNVPLIFQKEIYASACIIGGIVYFVLLRFAVDVVFVQLLVIVLIVATRLLAVRFNWSLPTTYKAGN